MGCKQTKILETPSYKCKQCKADAIITNKIPIEDSYTKIILYILLCKNKHITVMKK